MKRDCIECGEPIAPKRLAAKPNALRCVVCQEATDLTPYEMFGSSRLAGVMAVKSEGDGDHHRVGGDSCAW